MDRTHEGTVSPSARVFYARLESAESARIEDGLLCVSNVDRVPVSHDSAIPPSRQIANELREKITTGYYPPGSRLPSITSLMQEYEVARNTARRALAILEEEGLIEIVHGWGSFTKS